MVNYFYKISDLALRGGDFSEGDRLLRTDKKGHSYEHEAHHHPLDGWRLWPSSIDLTAYHRLIGGDGRIHNGEHPIEANKGPGKLKSGTYVAHTLSRNTGSIGIAICAMAGDVVRPIDAGRAPIKAEQLDALSRLIAELCDQYQLPITCENVLTHAEVQSILGIVQIGKWDITWLPGMQNPGDAIAVGDQLRERARAIRQVTPESARKPKPTPAPVAPAPAHAGFWALLQSIFIN